MKIYRLTFLVISFLLLGFSFSQTVCTDPETVVTFKDVNLENAISEKIGKSPLTCQDLADLTDLTAQNLEIRSLEGLENAVNLTSLRLNNNEISDLSPIANLSQLTRLWLNNNQVQDNDISSLKDLVLLRDLRLNNNQLEIDFSLLPLISFEDLRVLHLQNNELTSLQTLAFFLNLQDVNVGGNPLDQSSLEVLKLLPNLKNVNLAALNLEDSEYIASLFQNPEAIAVLVLNTNKLSEIKPLTVFSNLKQLHLFRNPLNEFQTLSEFSQLTRLNLGGTGIGNSDLTVLNQLSQLVWLSLNNSNLQDISNLTNVSGLQEGSTLLLRNNCILEEDSTIQSLRDRGVDITISFGNNCTDG